MNESKIIAIANQKGGVGKTTTAINIATAIAAIGEKTLIIDLDPQGNVSTGFGLDVKDRKLTSYDLIIDLAKTTEAIKKTIIPNLDLIPANINLAAAEIELNHFIRKETVLRSKLKELDAEYKYIIIDCPPSLGLLTINALSAADLLIIPLQCEFFALEGLLHLMNTVSLIHQNINSILKIEGIALTMMDRRNRLAVQVENDVRSNFGDLVYNTTIPRNVKLSEAPSHGKPALIYDKKCLGSIAYMQLAQEILTKLRVMK
jgi:chromosome partitioning protein